MTLLNTDAKSFLNLRLQQSSYFKHIFSINSFHSPIALNRQRIITPSQHSAYLKKPNNEQLISSECNNDSTTGTDKQRVDDVRKQYTAAQNGNEEYKKQESKERAALSYGVLWPITQTLHLQNSTIDIGLWRKELTCNEVITKVHHMIDGYEWFNTGYDVAAIAHYFQQQIMKNDQHVILPIFGTSIYPVLDVIKFFSKMKHTKSVTLAFEFIHMAAFHYWSLINKRWLQRKWFDVDYQMQESDAEFMVFTLPGRDFTKQVDDEAIELNEQSCAEVASQQSFIVFLHSVLKCIVNHPTINNIQFRSTSSSLSDTDITTYIDNNFLIDVHAKLQYLHFAIHPIDDIKTQVESSITTAHRDLIGAANLVYITETMSSMQAKKSNKGEAKAYAYKFKVENKYNDKTLHYYQRVPLFYSHTFMDPTEALVDITSHNNVLAFVDLNECLTIESMQLTAIKQSCLLAQLTKCCQPKVDEAIRSYLIENWRDNWSKVRPNNKHVVTRSKYVNEPELFDLLPLWKQPHTCYVTDDIYLLLPALVHPKCHIPTDNIEWGVKQRKKWTWDYYHPMSSPKGFNPTAWCFAINYGLKDSYEPLVELSEDGRIKLNEVAGKLQYNKANESGWVSLSGGWYWYHGDIKDYSIVDEHILRQWLSSGQQYHYAHPDKYITWRALILLCPYEEWIAATFYDIYTNNNQQKRVFTGSVDDYFHMKNLLMQLQHDYEQHIQQLLGRYDQLVSGIHDESGNEILLLDKLSTLIANLQRRYHYTNQVIPTEDEWQHVLTDKNINQIVADVFIQSTEANYTVSLFDGRSDLYLKAREALKSFNVSTLLASLNETNNTLALIERKFPGQSFKLGPGSEVDAPDYLLQLCIYICENIIMPIQDILQHLMSAHGIELQDGQRWTTKLPSSINNNNDEDVERAFACINKVFDSTTIEAIMKVVDNIPTRKRAAEEVNGAESIENKKLKTIFGTLQTLMIVSKHSDQPLLTTDQENKLNDVLDEFQADQ